MITGGGGGAGGLGGLWGGPVVPERGRWGGTCGGVPLGFPFGTGGVFGWVAVGTGVACKDLEEPAGVWSKGSSFALPLDTGGVRSELSSGIESLELPGSVLVGREGVSWGLGVLGQLASFWRVATILVSASCSKLLMLSVSSSVEDLLCVDSLSDLCSLSDSSDLLLSSFSNSPGIEGFVSSTSEVLGLWKCTFQLLRYFHLEYRVSHLICLLWKVAVCSTKSKFLTRNQNFLEVSSLLSEVNHQTVPIPLHQIAGVRKRAKRYLVSL